MTVMCQETQGTMVVPAFHVVAKHEVKVNSMIGSGAYSTVYKVDLAPSVDTDDSTIDSTDDSPAAKPYALKKLHGHCRESQDDAALDLLSEANLLCQLPSHDNIVGLRGISSNFFCSPKQGFLLLDYLPESLTSRLSKWKETRHRDPQKRVMEVCLPVARALAFLHLHNICYRDLKPENIGFDADGTVRLYDFGFARKIQPGELPFRKRVGTPRYMAPEVMKKQKYGKPADVYSLTLLIWQVLALKKPYDGVPDFENLMFLVAEQHIRPSVSWTLRWKEIKQILSSGWHKDQHARATAERMVANLEIACHGSAKKGLRSSSSVERPAKRSLVTSAA